MQQADTQSVSVLNSTGPGTLVAGSGKKMLNTGDIMTGSGAIMTYAGKLEEELPGNLIIAPMSGG